MKFYKGDHVTLAGVSHVIETADNNLYDGDRYTLEGLLGWYWPSDLQLIRRADEMPWPDDVPRCELPLPDGKTRWVNRGRGFISDSRCAYWNHDQWQTTKRGSGIAGYHYAEAVNDEDYVPPQLSETTNSSQVESKITVERSTMVKHADLHNVASVRIDGGRIFTHLNRLSISASQALALAELLTAAAKEAQQ